ncbi:CPBP family intramembrane metalloprotease [Rhodococcus opacus]|nr:CPBP family intramembrane metalloprotease [Rhodococcus opacus]
MLGVVLFAWNAPTHVGWALGGLAGCPLLYGVLAVGVLRPTATSTVRSELGISLNWLGLGRPRPNSRRRKLIKIAVWCLLIPGVLAFFQFAFINRWVGEVFPVTDPGIRAARVGRADLVLSSGVYGIFVYAFIRAGMLEELAARLLPLIVQRWRPGAHLVAAIAVASTAWFSWGHVEYGTANVLTALVGGVVYMGLALSTRSLWPAIMAHGIYDLFVFWVRIRM